MSDILEFNDPSGVNLQEAQRLARLSKPPPVGERIAAFRRGYLTQEELAARCGVSRQRIIDLEKGHAKKFGRDELPRVANGLRVPLEALFHDEISPALPALLSGYIHNAYKLRARSTSLVIGKVQIAALATLCDDAEARFNAGDLWRLVFILQRLLVAVLNTVATMPDDRKALQSLQERTIALSGELLQRDRRHLDVLAREYGDLLRKLTTPGLQ